MKTYYTAYGVIKCKKCGDLLLEEEVSEGLCENCQDNVEEDDGLETASLTKNEEAYKIITDMKQKYKDANEDET